MPRQKVSASLETILNYNYEERLTRLEEKMFKEVKRKQATKSQKLLIMKDLGLLERIDSLGLSQNKRALLVSVLIDADPGNIEKDLNQIYLKKPSLDNEANYKFLCGLYSETGQQTLHKQAERKLLDIRKNK